MGEQELSEMYLQIDQSYGPTNIEVPQTLIIELEIAFNYIIALV